MTAVPDSGAVTLSIITATHNVEADLPQLIRSLHTQTDPDFEWVVADGGSSDGTLGLLEQAGNSLHLKLDSRRDFGIYDALNRAVNIASGTYYVVAGADDVFSTDAVARFKEACAASQADFVTALVEWDGALHGVRERRWEWLNRQFAHVSSHAVGLAIRRKLHEEYGWYSRKLPIAADQLFILQAIHGGATVYEADFRAGAFGVLGITGTDKIGMLVESYRAQIQIGHNTLVQLALLNFRVIKYLLKSRRQPR